MFERFTEYARRALFFARYEASQLGSPSIEIEHLLLGLTRESRGSAGGLVARASEAAVGVRADLAARTGTAANGAVSHEIPFSAGTKRALQCAGEEADGLSHSDIDVEHLLLGILREGTSAAAAELNEAGLTLEAARAEVRRRPDRRRAEGRPPEDEDYGR
jgi:ATP-dependent Clp protease ATP-binding subunit ClpC